MAAKKSKEIKKVAWHKKPGHPPYIQFRFASDEHYDLVKRAQQHAGTKSLNGWLVQVSLAAARLQLGE